MHSTPFPSGHKFRVDLCYTGMEFRDAKDIFVSTSVTYEIVPETAHKRHKITFKVRILA